MARPALTVIVVVIIIAAAGSLYAIASPPKKPTASPGGTSSSTTTASGPPSVVEARVDVRTQYKGSEISVSANAAIPSIGRSSSLVWKLAPQHGHLSNGSNGYLGYYSGAFEVASGLREGSNVTVAVSYDGFSTSGVIAAPPQGETSVLPLFMSALPESAANPIEISISNGASSCSALGGDWQSSTFSHACTTFGVVDVPFTIDYGATLVNAGVLEVSPQTTIRINGVLDNAVNGTVNNMGTMSVGGTLDSGTMENSNLIFNSGTIDNGGTFSQSSTSTMYNYGSLENPYAANFVSGGSIFNYGTINNDGGTMSNNGDLYNNRHGSISTAGQFYNDGTLYNGGGSFDNGFDGAASNGGTVVNSNSSFSSEGTFNNDGTFDNLLSTLYNDGNFNNGGLIDNGAQLVFASISNGGDFVNSGTINNFGAISDTGYGNFVTGDLNEYGTGTVCISNC